MEDDVVVQVDNVSMQYKVDVNHVSSIKEFFVNMLKGKMNYRLVNSLVDVSFSVKKGEIIGIIGQNGAGKSTILKILGGILSPTKGKVWTKGNVVPMLELGSGFDPDLTGCENIFLNGAILGFSKKFLLDKFDEIVNFSELGEAIYMPIRTYSSGMIARLAFSIAVLVSPDIMIVDEILSVGDARFQEKSMKKMVDLMKSGTTVLFVSHSLKQVESLCTRAIWLDHGHIHKIGDTKTLCYEYSKMLQMSK